jgi:signal transduction histidine kinase
MSTESSGSYLNPASPENLERILSASRYGTVGRLADSVTHDLNNMLGASVAYAELIGLEAGLRPESRRMLGEIVSSLLRGSELMASLTALTRADILRAAPFDAATLARQALLLAGYVLKRSKVSIETHIPEHDITVVGDAPRLQVALLHLINNAREALEANGDTERQLCISVSYTEDAVQFSAWNSGPAIADTLRAKIFEPYFTTKPSPHLGLGLHAARAAALLHEGELRYCPEQGFELSIRRFPEFARKMRGEVSQ